jgi:DNA modification methylase
MREETICNYMQMTDSFSTADVAAKAGVHRDTLLRWLREGTVSEPSRDRNGWRIFSPSEVEAIVAHARGADVPYGNADDYSAELARLDTINWDFASAKTSYLTHGIHPYPAKFIPQIPNALIQELSSVGETIADIFCGSGTTLLEALQLKRNAVGIDANPLAALISRAKTTPLGEGEFEELEAHRADCIRALSVVSSATDNLFYQGMGFKSDGWRPEASICEFWFDGHVVEELAELRLLIASQKSHRCRTLCDVCFSSIVVAVSKQDSDTRYVRREKRIGVGDVFRRYLSQLEGAIAAVRELSDIVEERFSCEVLNTNILSAPSTAQFDLMVASPPYPNAFSYHLYHRTRLAWLGHDVEAFKKIEIGSHRKYSSKSANKATAETFKAEFASIFEWLRLRLKDRRFACFVIGDSTLDGKRIDNATLIADSGKLSGFREVRQIERTISSVRKSFNPKIGKIKTEKILILQKV